jgi:hypothetical protein
MAYVSASLLLSDYRDHACAEIYGGDGYTSLDTGEKAEIDRLIKRAERTLYLHPPVSPPHVWSHLQRRALIDLWADIDAAPNLVVNGSFNDAYGNPSADGWTLGTGWSVSSNRATGAATTASLTQTTAPLTVGTSYTITYSVTATVGTVTLLCGTTAGTARTAVIAGTTYTEVLTCAGNGGLSFLGSGGSGFSGTIDSVACVETADIPGSGTTVGMAAAGTQLNASTDVFYPTMLGKNIVVFGGGTFVPTVFLTPAALTVTPANGVASFATKAFSISSNGAFTLPVDFESPQSSTLTIMDQSGYPDVPLVEERMVTSMQAQNPDTTGYPQMAAIRWGTSDGTALQGQELVVWPYPDDHYQVALPYLAQPQCMSASTDYPMGGPEFADILLSFVLAICEEAKIGRRGDRWAEAIDKCRVAAHRDRSRHHNFIAGHMRPDAGSYSRDFNVKRLILPTS